jgi:glycosyltransferase involved in cell wall biosynthesis
MRVLQIHSAYREPGGEEAVARVEAALLRRGGHEVVEYHVQNPRSAGAAAAALAVSSWNVRAARRVAEVAAHVRPEVAHVHNTWFSLSPSIFPALRKLGVPVVATLHNYRLMCSNGLLFRDGRPCELCVGSHPWHGVRYRCFRNSTVASVAAAGVIAINDARHTWTRDVDLFLALTEFARARYIKGGLPAGKIVVKPNVVLDLGPRPDRASRSNRVLYVGRLSLEKGVRELIDAWTAADRSPLELMVVGDGPLRAELEQQAAGRVSFAGRIHHDDVRHLMAQARALVFPSRWYETFGLVVVEAMAAGLPVIVGDLGGMPELVSPQAGWRVSPPESPGAWSTALDGLRDDAAVDRRGRLGRVAYEQRFSGDVGLRALEDAYDRARRRARETRR